MELKNSSAIVTGGASGLGEATVLRLAKAGAQVVVLDLNEEKGKAVAEQAEGLFVKADVADETEVQAAVAAAIELAPLRVLVNSAGIGGPIRTIDRDGAPHPMQPFERIMRVNVLGTFNCIRLAAAAMAGTEPVDADGQRGAILNTASIAAFDGQVGQASYSASKGAVVGMTLPIARDLATLGIRVNTIAPGLIDTPIYGTGEFSEQFKARLGENVPFPQRLGVADEFATMALELLTNDYMNGETIRVDGGVRLPRK
jgi:NAD(P)-dependent dehydrogenase (short-subunit alcohol dehydrogenase family)